MTIVGWIIATWVQSACIYLFGFKGMLIGTPLGFFILVVTRRLTIFANAILRVVEYIEEKEKSK